MKQDVKKPLRFGSVKLEKLAHIVQENLNTKGVTKTKQEMLREAGYGEARAMKRVKDPFLKIQPHLAPLVERLERERDRAIEAMRKKIGKAGYGDVVGGVDKLTKNIQLITGRPTSRSDFRGLIAYKELTDEQLRDISTGKSVPGAGEQGAGEEASA